jgi:hypothetical protein
VRAKMLAGIERTAEAVAAMSNALEPEIKITDVTSTARQRRRGERIGRYCCNA